MTLSERIVYIHQRDAAIHHQAPNLHARRLITRLESPCMSCVCIVIPSPCTIFFFCFFWALLGLVRKTKRMPLPCHSASPSALSFLKERPNEKIKISILKSTKCGGAGWGENAEQGISRCGSAEWPIWQKKSDLHKKNLHRPCTLISHHASVIVYSIWSLTLCLFRPKRIFYNNTAWDLVKGNATREARGGEHHTFGACDRCQSSAIFSSFLCFSGRFTSSSTRLAIPPVSMSFLLPRVAFAEGGERLGEMGSWPVVRPSGAAPKPMLANKKVGLMTEKVELTWGLSATRFAGGGRWARCRIPAMRPDWVESSMY